MDFQRVSPLPSPPGQDAFNVMRPSLLFMKILAKWICTMTTKIVFLETAPPR
jgi:hypothetical protein